MDIKCSVNGHTYETQKLYLEDFKKLGIIYEEKLMPFIVTIMYCHNQDCLDKDIIYTLYKSSQDVFNREDVEFLLDLVMNKEHMLIDGKKPDCAEWERHWQSVGYIDYRTVAIAFTKENLGNFSGLLALIPDEWATPLKKLLDGNLSSFLQSLNQMSTK